MTEMNIGKWYDPISQRWIVPREPLAATASSSQSNTEKTLESRRRDEARRIWELLVDCCAQR
ncbi:hypothetical protein [Bradyrhizobium cajani]|uniref:Uncharacterized protein n=1 Tax=Bradyrhizobium cajani TaxID=1928661 RepID=A0A844TQD4_9BRAD|nr:hypothetical protein [Bradyrhizobium cajani]MCP3369432.1 hypothetical protein [Bradyrhizobium cajani]MVT77462.1 hypothetical protein [Bradyrhizobium cajani]